MQKPNVPAVRLPEHVVRRTKRMVLTGHLSTPPEPLRKILASYRVTTYGAQLGSLALWLRSNAKMQKW